MAHEISQFEIPDRQMLVIGRQPKIIKPTDIGNARITNTLFGNAKIRVTCQKDKNRRMWLISALLLTLVFAVSWQMWLKSQQADLGEASRAPLSSSIRVSAPVFLPEYSPPPENPRLSRRNPKTPTEILLNDLSTRRPPPPSAPPTPTAAVAPVAAPVVASLPATTTTSKPVNTQPNQSLHSNSANAQQPSNSKASVQPHASQVAEMHLPAAAPPDMAQPIATPPAIVTPKTEPSNNAAIPSVVTVEKPADPVSGQP